MLKLFTRKVKRQIGLMAALATVSLCCLAAKNQDNSLPIQIVSDSAVFDDSKGQATHHGHVILTQGTRKLHAHKLVIYRNKQGHIARVEAFGSPATFESQPDLDKPIAYGQANVLKYYPIQDQINLIGDASLKQNDDLIQGPSLEYQIEKRMLTAIESNQGRTTVIINPKHAAKIKGSKES